MYYLKIGKLWISNVEKSNCFLSENMIAGWSDEDDAYNSAKIAAELLGRDVLMLKLEVIRSIEAD